VLLIGRSAEQERIERLLRDAQAGESGVLVVRGEAGIGKTALLRYAMGLAESMTVVRASGVESEAELEFSGLLEVCRPLFPWLDALAPHQATALRVALGLEDGRQTDRFAVGAGTLALFAAAAEERPLLVVVDDAHWLDDGSAAALRFAARRLFADRVAVLFAVRETDARTFEPDGFDELGVAGLHADDAHRLLERVSSASLPEAVAERIWEATGGNPLALVELPGLLAIDQLAGVEPVMGPLPAGAGVERAFSRRLELLDENCRRALLVLAAASSRDLAPCVAALGRLGLGVEALEPAETADLLELDGDRFAFQHPLLRAVVYQAAPGVERRQAHRALADAVTGPGVDELRAWHLAMAAVGPDPEAADALALVADRARDRSGFAAASAAFERSARLSSDDGARVERLAGAAESAWEGGAADRALGLVDEALESSPEAALRSRLLLLRGRIALQSGFLPDARAQLREAARAIEAADPLGAASVLTYVVFTCHFEGRIEEALDVARKARALVAADGSAGDLRMDYVLGRSLLLAGHTEAGTPLLDRMVDAVRASENPPRTQLAAASVVTSVLERPRENKELVARVLELARDEGPMALVFSLSVSAETELRANRLKRSVASATEGLELARELGQSNIMATFLVALSKVDALQGADDAFREHAAEARSVLEPAGMALPLEQLRSSEGLLELGIGRLDQAVDVLANSAGRIAEMALFDRDAMPEPDLVEALVRLGRPTEARAAFDAWNERGVPREVTIGGALAARCEGLLTRDDAFSALFSRAIEGHAALEDTFGEARTRLCFGERLRRAGLRVEARNELRAALETFERLGAAPWAERARVELRATGERLRRQEEARDELTPQELQVALQVAEGKTNKEVAAAMFLSPKTIEFHLGRIFRKLGVASRTELARRISAEAQPAFAG
jgi:DNA-binding CsgD family transcriptional regulator